MRWIAGLSMDGHIYMYVHVHVCTYMSINTLNYMYMYIHVHCIYVRTCSSTKTIFDMASVNINMMYMFLYMYNNIGTCRLCYTCTCMNSQRDKNTNCFQTLCAMCELKRKWIHQYMYIQWYKPIFVTYVHVSLQRLGLEQLVLCRYRLRLNRVQLLFSAVVFKLLLLACLWSKVLKLLCYRSLTTVEKNCCSPSLCSLT